MTIADVLVTVTPVFGLLAIIGIIGAMATSDGAARRQFLGIFVVGIVGLAVGIGMFVAIARSVGA